MAEAQEAAADGAAAVAEAAQAAAAAAEAGKQNGAASGAANGSEADWRDEFAGGDQKVRDQLGRFASKEALGKSVLETRQKLSQAIFKPGKDAKPEDVQAYRKALGVPEKPEAYGDLLPKDAPAELREAPEIKETLNSFLAVAHEAGLTPEQAQRLVDWNLKQPGVADPAVRETIRSVLELRGAQEKSTETLETEWGPDFDANLNAGKAAVVKYGGSELKEFLEKSGLGNAPELLRAFAKIGRETVMEDEYRTAPDGAQVEGIEAEIAKLRGLQTSGNMADRRQWEKPETQERLFALYDRLHAMQGKAA